MESITHVLVRVESARRAIAAGRAAARGVALIGHPHDHADLLGLVPPTGRSRVWPDHIAYSRALVLRNSSKEPDSENPMNSYGMLPLRLKNHMFS